MNKTILVCGAGGFIGTHLVNDLKAKGHTVIGVDIKHPLYEDTRCNQFYKQDLREANMVDFIFSQHEFDEVYQLAADMGGAGYIFVGENDADIMHNSVSINLNVLEETRKLNETLDSYEQEYHPKKQPKIFYSGSACMYPEHNQVDPDDPNCREDSAYPAAPDSEYGWEKLFSERLYLAYNRNHGIPVRIARYHNIFGPEGTWDGGREKAPAAICRKVAYAEQDEAIEVWGDGEQTRSFLYIDECIEATRRLMESDFLGPVNIGSEEMVSINQLVDTAAKVAGKTIEKNHIDGPLGVRGRNSNNDLIRKELDWDYEMTLEDGIRKTYNWIMGEIAKDVVETAATV